MEYELVYDAARDFAGWQIVAGGVAFFAFLIVTIYFDQFIPRIVHWLVFPGDHITDWRRASLGVVVLLLGVVSAGIINENLKLRSISKKNDCKQLSGMVMDFKSVGPDIPGHPIRNYKETFTLNDIGFKYDTVFMMTGYNRSASDGGPIYEGATIRLCYIDRLKNRKNEKIIIRVETASNSIE